MQSIVNFSKLIIEHLIATSNFFARPRMKIVRRSATLVLA
ncbi:MAG: hypothetical protein ACI9WV_002525 [Patiriisocius sp.]